MPGSLRSACTTSGTPTPSPRYGRAMMSKRYRRAFTLDQYGHITETMKQASAQRMEAFIQGLKKG